MSISSNKLLKIFVPAFEIAIDGQPLPLDIARTILEVSVTENSNPPGQFSFVVNDPKMIYINKTDGRFTEGKLVEISIGYTNDMRKMITGQISALTADFPNSGPATFQVEGFDLLHRMTRGTIYRKFDGASPNSAIPDSQIISQIASEVGLRTSVDPTPTRTKPRVQNQVTNLAFLEELTGANGYYLWIEGDVLYFKAELPAVSEIMQLEWGKTLMSFSPRLSTAGQVETVEVRGWDPNQKQSFSVRVQGSSNSNSGVATSGKQQIAKGSGGKSELVITNAPVSSAKEAQVYAEKVLLDKQRSLITGNGTSFGQPKMRVGMEIQLTGIGRFSGTYLIEQVTHTLSGSGYQTSFQVRMKL